MSPLRAWTEQRTLWIEIDRPEALNAVDFSVMEALEGAIARARDTSEIRALVITGAGEKSFVSGGDLKQFSTLTTHEEIHHMATRMRAILASLEALDCWVIAAVNADAFGGGCETMVACDLRVASDEARFGWTQARFAVPCGWGGMTRLVELVGPSKAMLWLGTERRVSAEEALQSGLVDELVPANRLREHVRALCEQLTRHERPLIAAMKRGARDATRLPREQALEAELEPFIERWLAEPHASAVESFLTREKNS